MPASMDWELPTWQPDRIMPFGLESQLQKQFCLCLIVETEKRIMHLLKKCLIKKHEVAHGVMWKKAINYKILKTNTDSMCK